MSPVPSSYVVVIILICVSPMIAAIVEHYKWANWDKIWERRKMK